MPRQVLIRYQTSMLSILEEVAVEEVPAARSGKKWQGAAKNGIFLPLFAKKGACFRGGNRHSRFFQYPTQRGNGRWLAIPGPQNTPIPNTTQKGTMSG